MANYKEMCNIILKQMKSISQFVAGFCGCLLMSSCIGWDIWSDSIQVEEVVNGNTLKLENGIHVVLLGLDDTKNSKQRLERLLCPKDGDKKDVWFIKDSSFPDVYYLDEDNNTFYAYVQTSTEAGEEICLNSMILKEGLSDLYITPYLQDSLNKYRQLAEHSPHHEIVLNPVVKPVLDSDVQDIIDEQGKKNEITEVHDHSGDVWMMDGNLNCDMLNRACDYTNSITKSFANMLASKSEGPYNVRQICEIYSYLRNKWKYVNDPADKEYVAYASESICDSHLSGDCDDFAVLMAACILSIGGNACINTASRGNEGHAFAEVDVSQFNMTEVESTVMDYFGKYMNISTPLSTRHDGNRIWLNLDWQTSYPGGKYWLNRNYDVFNCYFRQNGQWIWQKIR